jgi:2-(1,2-epoxy-1,2-dihydrophenyl)acetyl-CoA isomerase
MEPELEDAMDELAANPLPVLLTARTGHVLTLTLNRPDKLNAFNVGLHEALIAALETAAHDPECRAVVLTGAGRAFCAGQDLSDRVFTPGGPRTDLGATLTAFWNPLARAIRHLPKPVIAAVNGTAAGAGANLALACDVVIAARSARFIQSFGKLGLVPDTGGTWTLPRLVGDARARALAMLAEPISAEQAEAWGMIWKTVDDAALTTEVQRMAETLARGPTHGFGLQKKAFLASATNDFDAQLDLERDLQREAGFTPDYAEGVTAFMEKRAPNYTGRPE